MEAQPQVQHRCHGEHAQSLCIWHLLLVVWNVATWSIQRRPDWLQHRGCAPNTLERAQQTAVSRVQARSPAVLQCGSAPKSQASSDFSPVSWNKHPSRVMHIGSMEALWGSLRQVDCR